MWPRKSNRGAALGIAAGGVLLGHRVTYALLSPSLGARRALLARTGHAYLGMADQLALAVTLLALGAVFLGRLTRSGEGQPRTLELVGRLASFQVAAFLAMEVAERVSAGSPLGELFHGPLLGIGIIAQVAVAACGALAIRWLLRAADLATTFAGTHIPLPRPAFTTLTLPVPVAVAGVAVATVRGRGPPQLP